MGKNVAVSGAVYLISENDVSNIFPRFYNLGFIKYNYTSCKKSKSGIMTAVWSRGGLLISSHDLESTLLTFSTNSHTLVNWKWW